MPIKNNYSENIVHVIFDTLNLYYLPQYDPIFRVLKQRGYKVSVVCYRGKNDIELCNRLFRHRDLEVWWVDDAEEASRYYALCQPSWIFFGNTFYYLDVVHRSSKTVQLGHGIGPKPGYYKKSNTPTTIRFIEGKLRFEIAQAMYPHCKMMHVGFSKMDPIFNGQEQGFDLASLNLDPRKPTILYAPTFNPSSLECFPDNWPQDFEGYNILIKPHSISQTRSRYKAQQKKLVKWSKYTNVYIASLEDISLLPFMKCADILLSEASSTLFEFVALDKPVIVCNFFKLKWTYRGPFKYRFERRFKVDNVAYTDIGVHVSSYGDLKKAVPQQLADPEEYHERRKQYTIDHVGPTDGKASERIVDYIEMHC